MQRQLNESAESQVLYINGRRDKTVICQPIQTKQRACASWPIAPYPRFHLWSKPLKGACQVFENNQSLSQPIYWQSAGANSCVCSRQGTGNQTACPRPLLDNSCLV